MLASWTGKLLGGRYRVGALLGVGGVGAVYAGVQEDLGRQVAIKILRPRIEEEEAQVLARLALEARAAGSLAHPNIIQITDFQNNPDEPAFLVMDLLKGWSLEAMLVAEAPISEERAAFIAHQVLDGLAAAHEAGILHRDLKPDNIFLTSVAGIPDIVKILDFGIAKLLHPEGPEDKITLTGDAPGTPAYMSPEQLYCKAVDQRTDIYSLGVVLYRMLTGELPFDAPNFSALVLQIVDHEYTPLDELRPELDPALAALVARAMAGETGHRISDARAMQRALAPWLPAQVTADTTGPPVMPGAPTAGPLDEVDTMEMTDDQPISLIWGATGSGPAEAQAGDAPPAATTLSLSTGQSVAREPSRPGKDRLMVALAGLALVILISGLILYRFLVQPPPPVVPRAPVAVAAAARQVGVSADKPDTTPQALSPASPAPPPADLALAAAPDQGRDLAQKQSAPRKLKPGGLRVGLISRAGKPIVALVMVDGVNRGHTPLLLQGLRPGRHKIVLRPPGMDPIHRTIRIRPGQTAALPVQVGAGQE